jgi:hypothetical protein
MTAGNNHSGKLDARFHSSTVAGEARVKKSGKEFTCLVDREAFAVSLGADAPDLYEEEVCASPFPKKTKAHRLLKQLLSQVGKGEAAFAVNEDHITITHITRVMETVRLPDEPLFPLPNEFPGMGGMVGMIGGGPKVGTK